MYLVSLSHTLLGERKEERLLPDVCSHYQVPCSLNDAMALLEEREVNAFQTLPQVKNQTSYLEKGKSHTAALK